MNRTRWMVGALVGVLAVAWVGAGRPLAQRRGGRGGPRGERRSAPPGAALKHEIRDAKKRGAVCNDGSPAAFYFRPGRDPDRGKWIVFLQGGGGCSSEASCSSRWTEQHNLMSSASLPNQRAVEGIGSADEAQNPDFARFSFALLHYCSSDAYAGDSERRAAGTTLQFRGRRIVDALLEELMDRSVVGAATLREASDVLLAGSSAGGFGVHNNLDRIAARLSWVRVKGLADSGWVPDIAPLDASGLDVRPDTVAAFDYVNGQADESCVAANRQQAGKCFFESFVFPYLTTPMFVYADQRDPLHLGTYGVSRGGRRAAVAERAYVDDYARRLRESLISVPAVFSPALGAHTSLGNERYHSASIDGVPLAEAIARWFFDRGGATRFVR